MRAVIIADDLTGALDSSVAFSERGVDVICALSPDSFARAVEMNPHVVAVSTKSRELGVGEAGAQVARVRDILAASGQHPVVMKKIDSRLKGHVAAEIATLIGPGQKAVICPAIPRLGRFVVDGAVVGAGIDTPLPVATALGAIEASVLDAKTDMDIDVGLAAAPEGALIIGAAGMGEALARKLVPAPKPWRKLNLPGPALLAIGSRDPVTLAQLTSFTPLHAPNGVVPTPTPLKKNYEILQIVPGVDEVSGAVAGKNFAKGVANWVEEAGPATLFICGGESAAAIMAQLNITLLRVRGEILPGLPASTALDGVETLTLATKSGGFGAQDVLVKLVRKVVN